LGDRGYRCVPAWSARSTAWISMLKLT
jgi:hypothetical protein